MTPLFGSIGAALGMAGLVAITVATIGLPGQKQPDLIVRAAAASSTPSPAPAPKLAASVTAKGVTLTSVTLELPTSDVEFPKGPNADVINGNCVACHSAGMVLTQPSLSRKEWQAEVNKMRNVYKAPVSGPDADAIVDYLAATKGL